MRRLIVASNRTETGAMRGLSVVKTGADWQRAGNVKFGVFGMAVVRAFGAQTHKPKIELDHLAHSAG